MANEKSYFTFCGGHYNNTGKGVDPLRNRYCVGTREEMFKITNGAFAFQYSWEKFEPQIAQFNLTEIPMSEIVEVVTL